MKKRALATQLLQNKDAAEARREQQEEKARQWRWKAAHNVTIRYKKCMSDIDLSRTARRYAMTDRMLYEDHVGKADKQCRRRAGCSRYPDEAECEYDY